MWFSLNPYCIHSGKNCQLLVSELLRRVFPGKALRGLTFPPCSGILYVISYKRTVDAVSIEGLLSIFTVR